MEGKGKKGKKIAIERRSTEWFERMIIKFSGASKCHRKRDATRIKNRVPGE